MSSVRRVMVRTYGCQMNVHDSEKITNLLQHHGYQPTDELEDADLLIINTCSIREKAENQLYSDVGRLRAWKQQRPGRLLAVAGCVAQQAGDAVLKRFGHVDFVFGTHNLRLVPSMAAAALQGERQTRIDETGSLDRFDLPERHPEFETLTPGRAFVTVMEGCDMFCSFCIVPTTRGREISRPASDIISEVEALAARGVREVTLLGQTVNAYGRHDLRRKEARKARGAVRDEAETVAFAELLGRIDAIPGIERIRYKSPHPIFFDEALIRAHGELRSLCPHVHLPLQSGSDTVLKRMRRRYGQAEFLALVEALRAARPDIAISTDLIVGFPGETDADFRDTLSVMRRAAFVDSYAFKYSPRPGTAAADFADIVPGEVAQARLEQLQNLQRELTLTAHRARVGETTQVLVEGASRRGGRQLSGRGPYQRVVNFEVSDAALAAPGSLQSVKLLEATPHSLIGLLAVEAPDHGPGRELRRSVKTVGGSADELIRIGGVPN